MQVHQEEEDIDPDSPGQAANSDNSYYLNLSDELEDLRVSPKRIEFDYNSDMDTKFVSGTMNAFMDLDLTDISGEDLVHTLLYNGIMVHHSMEWTLLASLMITRLGSKGLPLFKRPLCQWCLKPALHKVGCGHCSLCAACGGQLGNCIQCQAKPDSREDKLRKVYQERPQNTYALTGKRLAIIFDQRFYTNSIVDADDLSKMIRTVCRGGLTKETWQDEVEAVLKKFRLQKLLNIFNINYAFKDIQLGYEKFSQSLLLSCLLARSELKCLTCILDDQKKEGNVRSLLHDCLHWKSCFNCILTNNMKCTEGECEGSLAGGHTVITHRIAPIK